jgi:DNA polymerase-3 subunit delta'
MRLAQALNCNEPEPPCLECSQCRRIASGIHSDVQLLTVEGATEGAAHKSISVEQLRTVESTVAHNPYEGRTRVVVIDPADQMSDSAQSAFLKTLEEPPEHVVFALIAANPDRLLETIRSRCARIDFHLVPSAEIEEALIARGLGAEQSRLLARLSGGRPGWAIEAASGPRLLEWREQTLATARALPSMPVADRMDLAERLSDAFKRERAPVDEQLAQWQAWWRDVLLVAADATDSVVNLDMIAGLREDAATYRRAEVARFLGALVDTRTYLAENVQSRIALEALMLDTPRLVTPIA